MICRPFKPQTRPITPLPHPTFFAPKSPFFPIFPVSNPIPGDFSRDRTRFFPFYRLFSFPFSHFESKFRRFFDGTSLFSAQKLTFSLLFPVLPHASGASLRDLTHYFLRAPLFALRKGFFISCFPHSSRPAHLPISIDFLSVPQSPRPSPPSPTFFLIPPHFSISLPN